MDQRTVDDEELIDEIRAFMSLVRVGEAILYGSRARGDYLHTSDVDLMLISPQFEGVRFVDRLPPLHNAWRLWWIYPELLAYTPEEFERAREGFGIEREAARTGIRITLEKDPATA